MIYIYTKKYKYIKYYIMKVKKKKKKSFNENIFLELEAYQLGCGGKKVEC